MNKKAQGGIVAFIFLVLVFVIMWATWLGAYLNVIGQQSITLGGYTGVEAFFYSNLNLWIFLVLAIAIVGWAYFGAQG